MEPNNRNNVSYKYTPIDENSRQGYTPTGHDVANYSLKPYADAYKKLEFKSSEDGKMATVDVNAFATEADKIWQQQRDKFFEQATSNPVIMNMVEGDVKSRFEEADTGSETLDDALGWYGRSVGALRMGLAEHLFMNDKDAEAFDELMESHIAMTNNIDNMRRAGGEVPMNLKGTDVVDATVEGAATGLVDMVNIIGMPKEYRDAAGNFVTSILNRNPYSDPFEQLEYDDSPQEAEAQASLLQLYYQKLETNPDAVTPEEKELVKELKNGKNYQLALGMHGAANFAGSMVSPMGSINRGMKVADKGLKAAKATKAGKWWQRYQKERKIANARRMRRLLDKVGDGAAKGKEAAKRASLFKRLAVHRSIRKGGNGLPGISEVVGSYTDNIARMVTGSFIHDMIDYDLTDDQILDNMENMAMMAFMNEGLGRAFTGLAPIFRSAGSIARGLTRNPQALSKSLDGMYRGLYEAGQILGAGPIQATMAAEQANERDYADVWLSEFLLNGVYSFGNLAGARSYLREGKQGEKLANEFFDNSVKTDAKNENAIPVEMDKVNPDGTTEKVTEYYSPKSSMQQTALSLATANKPNANLKPENITIKDLADGAIKHTPQNENVPQMVLRKLAAEHGNETIKWFNNKDNKAGQTNDNARFNPETGDIKFAVDRANVKPEELANTYVHEGLHKLGLKEYDKGTEYKKGLDELYKEAVEVIEPVKEQITEKYGETVAEMLEYGLSQPHEFQTMMYDKTMVDAKKALLEHVAAKENTESGKKSWLQRFAELINKMLGGKQKGTEFERNVQELTENFLAKIDPPKPVEKAPEQPPPVEPTPKDVSNVEQTAEPLPDDVLLPTQETTDPATMLDMEDALPVVEDQPRQAGNDMDEAAFELAQRSSQINLDYRFGKAYTKKFGPVAHTKLMALDKAMKDYNEMTPYRKNVNDMTADYYDQYGKLPSPTQLLRHIETSVPATKQETMKVLNPDLVRRLAEAESDDLTREQYRNDRISQILDETNINTTFSNLMRKTPEQRQEILRERYGIAHPEAGEREIAKFVEASENILLNTEKITPLKLVEVRDDNGDVTMFDLIEINGAVDGTQSVKQYAPKLKGAEQFISVEGNMLQNAEWSNPATAWLGEKLANTTFTEIALANINGSEISPQEMKLLHNDLGRKGEEMLKRGYFVMPTGPSGRNIANIPALRNVTKSSKRTAHLAKEVHKYNLLKWLDSDATWGMDINHPKYSKLFKNADMTALYDKVVLGKQVDARDIVGAENIEAFTKNPELYAEAVAAIAPKVKKYYSDVHGKLFKPNVLNPEADPYRNLDNALSDLFSWGIDASGKSRTVARDGQEIKPTKMQWKYRGNFLGHEPKHYATSESLFRTLGIEKMEAQERGEVLNEMGLIEKDGEVYQKNLVLDESWLGDDLAFAALFNENRQDGASYIVNSRYPEVFEPFTKGNQVGVYKARGYQYSDEGNHSIFKTALFNTAIDKHTEAMNPHAATTLKSLGDAVAVLSFNSSNKGEGTYRVDKSQPLLTADGILARNAKGQPIAAYVLQADGSYKNDPKIFEAEMTKMLADLKQGIVDPRMIQEVPLTGDKGLQYIDESKSDKSGYAGSFGIDQTPMFNRLFDLFDSPQGQDSFNRLKKVLNGTQKHHLRNVDNLLSLREAVSGVEGADYRKAGLGIQHILDRLNKDSSLLEDLSFTQAHGPDKLKTLLQQSLDESGNFKAENTDLLLYSKGLFGDEVDTEPAMRSLIGSQARKAFDRAYKGDMRGGKLTLVPDVQAAADISRLAEWSIARGEDPDFIAGKSSELAFDNVDENGYYKDFTQGVTLSKDFIESNNLRMGDRVFLKLTPTDDMHSLVPMRLTGMRNEDGVVTANQAYLTKVMGRDFDKDALSVVLADKDTFPREDFNAVWEHFTDAGIPNGIYKSNSEQIAAMESTIANGKTLINKHFGFKYTEPTILPQANNFKHKAWQSHGNPGKTIGVRNIITHVLNELPWQPKGDNLYFATKDGVTFFYDNRTNARAGEGVMGNELSSKVNYLVQKSVDSYDFAPLNAENELLLAFVNRVELDDGTIITDFNGRDRGKALKRIKEVIKLQNPSGEHIVNEDTDIKHMTQDAHMGRWFTPTEGFLPDSDSSVGMLAKNAREILEGRVFSNNGQKRLAAIDRVHSKMQKLFADGEMSTDGQQAIKALQHKKILDRIFDPVGNQLRPDLLTGPKGEPLKLMPFQNPNHTKYQQMLGSYIAFAAEHFKAVDPRVYNNRVKKYGGLSKLTFYENGIPKERPIEYRLSEKTLEPEFVIGNKVIKYKDIFDRDGKVQDSELIERFPQFLDSPNLRFVNEGATMRDDMRAKLLGRMLGGLAKQNNPDNPGAEVSAYMFKKVLENQEPYGIRKFHHQAMDINHVIAGAKEAGVEPTHNGLPLIDHVMGQAVNRDARPAMREEFSQATFTDVAQERLGIGAFGRQLRPSKHYDKLLDKFSTIHNGKYAHVVSALKAGKQGIKDLSKTDYDAFIENVWVPELTAYATRSKENPNGIIDADKLIKQMTEALSYNNVLKLGSFYDQRASQRSAGENDYFDPAAMVLTDFLVNLPKVKTRSNNFAWTRSTARNQVLDAVDRDKEYVNFDKQITVMPHLVRGKVDQGYEGSNLPKQYLHLFDTVDPTSTAQRAGAMMSKALIDHVLPAEYINNTKDNAMASLHNLKTKPIFTKTKKVNGRNIEYSVLDTDGLTEFQNLHSDIFTHALADFDIDHRTGEKDYTTIIEDKRNGEKVLLDRNDTNMPEAMKNMVRKRMEQYKEALGEQNVDGTWDHSKYESYVESLSQYLTMRGIMKESGDYAKIMRMQLKHYLKQTDLPVSQQKALTQEIIKLQELEMDLYGSDDPMENIELINKYTFDFEDDGKTAVGAFKDLLDEGVNATNIKEGARKGVNEHIKNNKDNERGAKFYNKIEKMVQLAEASLITPNTPMYRKLLAEGERLGVDHAQDFLDDALRYNDIKFNEGIFFYKLLQDAGVKGFEKDIRSLDRAEQRRLNEEIAIPTIKSRLEGFIYGYEGQSLNREVYYDYAEGRSPLDDFDVYQIADKLIGRDKTMLTQKASNLQTHVMKVMRNAQRGANHAMMHSILHNAKEGNETANNIALHAITETFGEDLAVYRHETPPEDMLRLRTDMMQNGPGRFDGGNWEAGQPLAISFTDGRGQTQNAVGRFLGLHTADTKETKIQDGKVQSQHKKLIPTINFVTTGDNPKLVSVGLDRVANIVGAEAHGFTAKQRQNKMRAHYRRAADKILDDIVALTEREFVELPTTAQLKRLKINDAISGEERSNKRRALALDVTQLAAKEKDNGRIAGTIFGLSRQSASTMYGLTGAAAVTGAGLLAANPVVAGAGLAMGLAKATRWLTMNVFGNRGHYINQGRGRSYILNAIRGLTATIPENNMTTQAVNTFMARLTSSQEQVTDFAEQAKGLGLDNNSSFKQMVETRKYANLAEQYAGLKAEIINEFGVFDNANAAYIEGLTRIREKAEKKGLDVDFVEGNMYIDGQHYSRFKDAEVSWLGYLESLAYGRGFAMRMEAKSAEGAVKLSQLQVQQEVADMQGLKGTGYLPDHLNASIVNSFTEKAIGNYTKTIYQKTPIGRFYEMFNRFGKEQFVSNTRGRLLRDRLHDVYSKMHNSKEAKELSDAGYFAYGESPVRTDALKDFRSKLFEKGMIKMFTDFTKFTALGGIAYMGGAATEEGLEDLEYQFGVNVTEAGLVDMMFGFLRDHVLTGKRQRKFDHFDDAVKDTGRSMTGVGGSMVISTAMLLVSELESLAYDEHSRQGRKFNRNLKENRVDLLRDIAKTNPLTLLAFTWWDAESNKRK